MSAMVPSTIRPPARAGPSEGPTAGGSPTHAATIVQPSASAIARRTAYARRPTAGSAAARTNHDAISVRVRKLSFSRMRST